MMNILFDQFSRQYIIVLASFIVLSLCMPFNLLASTGIIVGTVADSQTGEPLPGARLKIQNTNIHAVTDIDGRYRLRQVPEGEHTITLSLIGFQESTEQILLKADLLLEQNFILTKDHVDGDRVFVEDIYRNNVIAQNQIFLTDRNAFHLVEGQINRFADITVEEALARIPGVMVGSRGEINIRGTGRNRFSVTMDGQRLGSTGTGDRSFDLGVIPTGMIRTLEVNKVITPDLEADALGGNINIVTNRPAGGHRVISASAAGMFYTNYSDHSGPGGSFLLNYSESPRDDFSIAFNLFYQKDNRGWESLDLHYGVHDFGDGPVDLFQRVTPALNIDESLRMGGGVQMTYQPSAITTFHLTGRLNRNNQILTKHQNSWIGSDNWSDASTNINGTLGYEIFRKDRMIDQYMFQFTARHSLKFLNVSYRAGWSYSNIDQFHLDFPFEAARLDLSFDNSERNRPSIDLIDETVRSGDFRLQNMRNLNNIHSDHKYSGSIDFEIPFQFGMLKMGSSALITNKDNNFQDDEFRILGITDMTRFDLMGKSFNVFGQYDFPRAIHSSDAKTFFNNNIPAFRKDQNLTFKRSNIWNSTASEDIYSAYGMAKLGFGPIAITGGLRMEQTDASYNGKRVFFNPRGRFVQTIDTTKNVTDTEWFPNAQIMVIPFDYAKAGFAYSKTIARPDYNLLAPFELVDPQNASYFHGNPELKPVISNNFEIFFNYYFNNAGYIGTTLFYKELSNLIFESQRNIEIQKGEIFGFDELFSDDTPVIAVEDRTFFNNENNAEVYGIELYFQQNFRFLPGFLSNFSTFANYTWSQSQIEIASREGTVSLPGQSPHVVNASLAYDHGAFNGMISFHWTASSLIEARDKQNLAPAIHPTETVYMDRYQDGWKNVSISAGYRISDNFRIWASGYNVIGFERIEYEYSRDLYPVLMEYSGGRGLRIGIRYDY